MEIVKGYFDLCVDSKVFASDFDKAVRTLYEFGYRTIAINYYADQSKHDTIQKKPKRKQANSNLQEIPYIPQVLDIKSVKGCPDMKILNRLTVQFSTGQFFAKLPSLASFKQFHIVAAMPTTDEAFNWLHKYAEFDILCLNGATHKKIKASKKSYSFCINRDLYFELSYVALLSNDSARKGVISLAHRYHLIGKSKNIIISSYADNCSQFRGVYDIISLGIILGLSEGQCKAALLDHPKNVFLHSVARRNGKVSMLVSNLNKHTEAHSSEKEIMDADDLSTVEHRMKKIKTV